MAIRQLFKCDIEGCEATHAESSHGDGAPGWGALNGVIFHRGTPRQVVNPILCPKHLGITAEFVHGLRESVIVRIVK